jgi:periplasmic protein TonB
MTTPFKSQENFNELVFENKNKEYGAYALRKSQANTVTQSMFISMGGISLLVFAIFWFGKGKEKMPVLDGNIPVAWNDGVVIDLPKPLPVPDRQKAPTPPRSESGIIIASDNKDNTIDKTNDQWKISSNPSDKGIDSSTVPNDIPEFPKAADPVENNKAETFVDIMPEFDGNLYQFIKDNLKYPQIAKENGTDGLVALSFIIEKDGSIGDIKTLKEVGDGCTQEAIRVVKMMPKWKPGKNHGVPVRVIFNLPIKFRLQ